MTRLKDKLAQASAAKAPALAAPVVPPINPAPAAPVAGGITPEKALIKNIRFICAHNTETALNYAIYQTPFFALTIKQRGQGHNSAVSLLAAGPKIELGSGRHRREPT